jgi:tetratricopeptide (TPR) repeat protein
MQVRRILIPLLTAAVALIAAADTAAFAQTSKSRRAAPDKKEQEAARPARPARPDRPQRLAALFEALRIAPSAQAAQQVESRIEAMFLQSGSDTADLLVTRARSEMEAKDYDGALKLLDATIEIAPQFTEAYAQRATVHYLKKNLYRSLADLRVVIAREPRHFGSLAGLGVIFQDIGQHKLALDAFRRAVALHPHIKGIPEMMKRLEVRVEGREI